MQVTQRAFSAFGTDDGAEDKGSRICGGRRFHMSMYILGNVLFIRSCKSEIAGKSEEARTLKMCALTHSFTVLVQRQNRRSSLGSEFEGITENIASFSKN